MNKMKKEILIIILIMFIASGIYSQCTYCSGTSPKYKPVTIL